MKYVKRSLHNRVI